MGWKLLAKLHDRNNAVFFKKKKTLLLVRVKVPEGPGRICQLQDAMSQESDATTGKLWS